MSSFSLRQLYEPGPKTILQTYRTIEHIGVTAMLGSNDSCVGAIAADRCTSCQRELEEGSDTGLRGHTVVVGSAEPSTLPSLITPPTQQQHCPR